MRILPAIFFGLILASYAIAQTPNQIPAAPPGAGNQWTINQATQAFAYTPVNGQAFPPTRAIFVGTSVACNLNMKLRGDAGPQVWSNVAPGFVPVQAVDIEATSTTCTGIMLLY